MEHLANPVSEKLEFRRQSCNGIAEAIRGKEARLKTLWSKR
jgi:hypothetical protein